MEVTVRAGRLASPSPVGHLRQAPGRAPSGLPARRAMRAGPIPLAPLPRGGVNFRPELVQQFSAKVVHIFRWHQRDSDRKR